MPFPLQAEQFDPVPKIPEPRHEVHLCACSSRECDKGVPQLMPFPLQAEQFDPVPKIPEPRHEVHLCACSFRECGKGVPQVAPFPLQAEQLDPVPKIPEPRHEVHLCACSLPVAVMVVNSMTQIQANHFFMCHHPFGLSQKFGRRP